MPISHHLLTSVHGGIMAVLSRGPTVNNGNQSESNDEKIQTKQKNPIESPRRQVEILIVYVFYILQLIYDGLTVEVRCVMIRNPSLFNLKTNRSDLFWCTIEVVRLFIYIQIDTINFWCVKFFMCQNTSENNQSTTTTLYSSLHCMLNYSRIVLVIVLRCMAHLTHLIFDTLKSGSYI